MDKTSWTRLLGQDFLDKTSWTYSIREEGFARSIAHLSYEERSINPAPKFYITIMHHQRAGVARACTGYPSGGGDATTKHENFSPLLSRRRRRRMLSLPIFFFTKSLGMKFLYVYKTSKTSNNFLFFTIFKFRRM